MKVVIYGVLVVALLSASATGLSNCSGRITTFQSLEVSPSDPVISLATATQQFTARGTFPDGLTVDATSSVIWSSSDATVATVGNTEESNGLVTLVSAGTTTITATSSVTGISGNTTLTVEPAPVTTPTPT